MSRRGGRGRQAGAGCAWEDVDRFLDMAGQALRQRTQAAEELAAQLTVANKRLQQEIREKSQVARQEASASEDSTFLASQVQALMAEKQALRDRVQQAEREKQFLQEEVQLLRGLLAEGGAAELGEEGSARLHEELLFERHRTAALEAEAAQLRAEVAALQLQQGGVEGGAGGGVEAFCGRLAGLDLGCDSPTAHEDHWAHQHPSELSLSLGEGGEASPSGSDPGSEARGGFGSPSGSEE